MSDTPVWASFKADSSRTDIEECSVRPALTYIGSCVSPFSSSISIFVSRKPQSKRRTLSSTRSHLARAIRVNRSSIELDDKTTSARLYCQSAWDVLIDVQWTSRVTNERERGHVRRWFVLVWTRRQWLARYIHTLGSIGRRSESIII